MSAVAAPAAVGGWSREEEKAFENALATLLPTAPIKGEEEEEEKKEAHDDDWAKRWEEITARVPGGKTAEEVRRHYEILVEDVQAIEAGKVLIPAYVGEKENNNSSSSSREKDNKEQHHRHGGSSGDRRAGSCGGSGGGGGGGFDSGGHGKGGSKSEQERRKGIPWTEEEHKLFLLGLERFGKGDWRSISRNFVVSRTPTQVASHAQKYYIRLNSMNRDRRRSSIHDITSINNGELPSPQGPITGQTNAAGGPAMGPPVVEHHHPSHPSMPRMGMYGPPIGHPVTGHMISAAVGTPVMLPPVHSPYVMPVAYPMPQPTMHP